MEKIIIRGAKTHNLKNVNAELPRNQLVVITGPSGSGKSSLAFDTLYAEGQRRYLEGFSISAINRMSTALRDSLPRSLSIRKTAPTIPVPRLALPPKFSITCGFSTPGSERLTAPTTTCRWKRHRCPSLRNGFLPGLRKHRLFFCPPFRQTAARILSSSSRISRVRGSLGSESGVTLLKPKRRRLMRSRISVSELILWLTG